MKVIKNSIIQIKILKFKELYSISNYMIQPWIKLEKELEKNIKKIKV